MSTLFGVPTAADRSPVTSVIRIPPPLTYGPVAAPAQLPELRRQCEARSASACALLGRSLAVPAARSALRDYSQALHYLAQACALRHGPGCAGAGLVHAHGLGRPRNAHRANYYFARGCYHNDGYACYALGIAYQQGDHLVRSPRRAALYYDKGCRLNEGRSCNSLGACYRIGMGVRRDGARARSLYGRACALGNQVGCQNLSLMQVLP